MGEFETSRTPLPPRPSDFPNRPEKPIGPPRPPMITRLPERMGVVPTKGQRDALKLPSQAPGYNLPTPPVPEGPTKVVFVPDYVDTANGDMVVTKKVVRPVSQPVAEAKPGLGRQILNTLSRLGLK